MTSAGLTFLAPVFLGLLALCALVVLLHQQYGRRTVPFPTLLLWRRVEASRQQVRPGWRLPPISVPLLLQLAVVCLVALALARPVLVGPETPQHRIYVLDASGSMRGSDGAQTRFDDAVARLRQSLQSMLDPDAPRVSLILADSTPELVFARLRDDRDLLASAGPRLTVTDSGVDWAEVKRLVESTRRDAEPTELVLLTDTADAGSAAIGAPDLPLSTIAVGGTTAPHARVDARLAEVVGDPPNRFKLSGEVRFEGGAQSATVLVSFDAPAVPEPLQLASVTVNRPDGAPSGGSEAVPFDTELTIPGSGVLSAQVAGEASVGSGAVRFVVTAAAPQRRVLVIGAADASLLKALQALPATTVTQADALPADVSGIDLVVVDDASIPRQPETNVLWVGRAHLAGEADPPGVEPGEITAWRPEHPLSRGLVWRSVTVDRASKFPPWPDSMPIASAGDTPLVEARTTRYGREVRIAAEPASAWGKEPSFPQFLDNLLDWLGPKTEGRVAASCTAGGACDLDARWAGSTLERLADDRLDAAVSGTVSIAATDGFVPQAAGLYRHGSELLAINADASENDETVQANPVPPSPSALRFWPYLLAAAGLLLGLEAWVSMRQRAAPRWLWGTRLATLALGVAAVLNAPAPALTDPVQVAVVSSATLPGAPSPSDGFASRLVAERAGNASAAVISLSDASGVSADRDDAKVSQPTSSHLDSPAEAIRLAASMLPEGASSHLVLAAPLDLSEGATSALAASLQERGIKLDVPLPEPMPGGEVAVAEVTAPPVVLGGDSFPLTGIIRAATAGRADLEVMANGTRVAEQSIDLAVGDNPVEIAIPKAGDADSLYEMEVSAAGDTYPQNNRDGVHVATAAAPHILVLSADAEAGRQLADGLTAGGLVPTVTVPTGAPWLIEDWLKYDGYLLADVPALSLNTTQQALLEDAVSAHGRPLLLLGGPHSFGPGGYLQTVFDRLSPLSSRIPKPAPEAAMVFVIDRSGSMAQEVGDVDRLEIAKQATIAAIGLLNPQSQVAVIAFDTEPHLVVPLTPVTRSAEIANALEHVGPGGGTELQPALAAALDQLRDVNSPVKHIVALTDGLTPQQDFAPLVNSMKQAGVSISTIAIGTDANDRVLRDIAQMGGGVFHGSTDFKALPGIMTQETMLLSDSAVEERTTVPTWSDPRSDFLAGLPDTLPPIDGYVLTTEKPDAKVDLTIDNADGGRSPLLASWQYGSGRVLALATEADGPWTRGLAALPSYGSLWSEVLRHFISGAEQPGLTLHLSRHGDTVSLVAAVLDDKRLPRPELRLTGTLEPVSPLGPPSSATAPIALHEARPGSYEGSVDIDAPGDYRITVSDGEHTQSQLVHIGYPSRFAFAPQTSAIALAKATGGRAIPPGGALLPARGLALEFVPSWIFWALAALVLFMAELVVRYVGGLARRARRSPSKPMGIDRPPPDLAAAA